MCLASFICVAGNIVIIIPKLQTKHVTNILARGMNAYTHIHIFTYVYIFRVLAPRSALCFPSSADPLPTREP